MTDKEEGKQSLARRNPRQERARYKVELMFEAAMQLLETGEIASLTTNAVAAKAGVSIGSLYQYFPDKHALLHALLERETGQMSEQVLRAVTNGVVEQPGDRLRLALRAVMGAYGGHGRAHRLLMEYALTHGPGRRMSPLYAKLTELMATQGVEGAGGQRHPLTPAQAFVLTHAVAGVLRTLAATEAPPPLEEVEDALVQCVTGYVAVLRHSSG